MDSFQQNNPPNNNGNSKKPPPKKGEGRKKTNDKKIENEASRNVTFSKRRGGLFKKASELSTLCGAEVSVTVFFPSNKAHSFGSPNVDTIATRFRNQTSMGITRQNQSQANQNNPIARQRNQDLTAMESLLEEVKKDKKELNKGKRECQPILENFSIEQLNEEMEFMLNFKNAHETNVNDDESPKDSEVGSGDQLWGYHFQSNGYMYGNMHPSTAEFEMGSYSNNNAVFSNPDQTVNNFGDPYPNPNESGSSNLMFPYNHGLYTDFVPHDNDDDGTDIDDDEDEEEEEEEQSHCQGNNGEGN